MPQRNHRKIDLLLPAIWRCWYRKRIYTNIEMAIGDVMFIHHWRHANCSKRLSLRTASPTKDIRMIIHEPKTNKTKYNTQKKKLRKLYIHKNLLLWAHFYTTILPQPCHHKAICIWLDDWPKHEILNTTLQMVGNRNEKSLDVLFRSCGQFLHIRQVVRFWPLEGRIVCIHFRVKWTVLFTRWNGSTSLTSRIGQ